MFNKKFLKFHNSLQEAPRIDLKTVLSWSKPNQCCQSVITEIVGWFLGDILGQETPNIRDPYLNSTTVLFDIILKNIWLQSCKVQTKEKKRNIRIICNSFI